MLAAEKGRMEIVAELIDRGANVNLKNINGETALMVAINSFFYRINIPPNKDLLNTLIENGADLRFSSNKTVFDLGSYEGVTELLEAAWIKQCDQKIRAGSYQDSRIKVKDWNILLGIAKKAEHKNFPGLKITLSLFNTSAAESIGKLLSHAKTPIFKVTEGFITYSEVKAIGKTPDGKSIYTKPKEPKEIIFVDRNQDPIEFAENENNALDKPELVGKVFEFLGIQRIYRLSSVCMTQIDPPKIEIAGIEKFPPDYHEDIPANCN